MAWTGPEQPDAHVFQASSELWCHRVLIPRDLCPRPIFGARCRLNRPKGRRSPLVRAFAYIFDLFSRTFLPQARQGSRSYLIQRTRVYGEISVSCTSCVETEANGGPRDGPRHPRAEGRGLPPGRNARRARVLCAGGGLAPVEVIKVSPRGYCYGVVDAIRPGQKGGQGSVRAQADSHFGRHRAQSPCGGGVGAVRHHLAGRRRS